MLETKKYDSELEEIGLSFYLTASIREHTNTRNNNTLIKKTLDKKGKDGNNMTIFQQAAVFCIISNDFPDKFNVKVMFEALHAILKKASYEHDDLMIKDEHSRMTSRIPVKEWSGLDDITPKDHENRCHRYIPVDKMLSDNYCCSLHAALCTGVNDFDTLDAVNLYENLVNEDGGWDPYGIFTEYEDGGYAKAPIEKFGFIGKPSAPARDVEARFDHVLAKFDEIFKKDTYDEDDEKCVSLLLVNLGRQIGLRNEITLNTFETGIRFVAGCKKRDNTPGFGLQPEELQQLESLFSRFDLHTGKLRTGVTQLKITDFTGENKQSLSGKKRANDLLGEQGRQVTGETQEDAGSAKSRKTDSKVTGEDM